MSPYANRNSSMNMKSIPSRPGLLLFGTLMMSFSPTMWARAEETPSQIIIVLDASGSMWGPVADGTKIEVARESIHALVDGLDEQIELGLVAYGHRRKGDCSDIELLAPVGASRADLTTAVDEIKPMGMTPLTDAVETAVGYLKSTEESGSIILVSDGEETCRRDPCAAALALEASGVEVSVHVIAFDLDAETTKSIACLATHTAGQLLQANDAATLTDALEVAIEASRERDLGPEDLSDATLKAPAEVFEGSRFQVEWTGPQNATDFITIVPKGTQEGAHRNYAYVKDGSPVSLSAFMGPGEAELRYITGRSRTTLGRSTIAILPVTATIEAQTRALIGSQLEVRWTGPGYKGDYITIVPVGSKEGTYQAYTYTRAGSPLEVEVPMETGDWEVWYVVHQGRKTLARSPLAVEPVGATLDAARRAGAGSQLEVRWTGPAYRDDYITIVPAGSEEGTYQTYTYTQAGSPLEVEVPMEAGEWEVWYVVHQGRKTLARSPLTVESTGAVLEAASNAVAGSQLEVRWTGPGNKDDYITIVPAGSEEGTYQTYTYTREGSPLKVEVPMETGDWEVRYVAHRGKRTLARTSLTVESVGAELEAASSAVAGSQLEVRWTGPAYNSDYITIVPADSEEGTYQTYTYTRAGSPLEVEVPMEAGEWEVWYVAHRGRKNLARRPLTVEPVGAALDAASNAVAGSRLEVRWTGPGYKSDYITIVPANSEEGTYQTYAYTRAGNPLEVEVPTEAGEWEVWYVAHRGRKTLARSPLTVVSSEE